jgi:hypothetical protein
MIDDIPLDTDLLLGEATGSPKVDRLVCHFSTSHNKKCFQAFWRKKDSLWGLLAA